MKLIIHIGMPKTGSTALQRSLRLMHSALLQRGILYPRLPGMGINQNTLWLLTRSASVPSRYFRHLLSHNAQYVAEVLQPAWTDLLRQIERHRPHTLILSGELLFDGAAHDHDGHLRQALRDLTTDIEPVVYVRQPSRHYLSGVQEELKRSSSFHPPSTSGFRTHVEAWEQHLQCPVRVFAYSTGELIAGDITTDFLCRMLGQDVCASLTANVRSNDSLSAESMAILQDIRAALFPGRDGEFMPIDRSLLKLLQRLDTDYPAARKPALKPGIAEFIDHSCADLLWLRDTYGIVFPDIDYAQVGKAEGSPFRDGPLKVADICQVDPVRKRVMQARTLQLMHRNLQEARHANRGPIKSLLRRVFG